MDWLHKILVTPLVDQGAAPQPFPSVLWKWNSLGRRVVSGEAVKSEPPPGRGMQDARRSQLYGGFRQRGWELHRAPQTCPGILACSHLSGPDRLTSEGHSSTRTLRGSFQGSPGTEACSQDHPPQHWASASNFRVTLEVSGQSGFWMDCGPALGKVGMLSPVTEKVIISKLPFYTLSPSCNLWGSF